MKMLFLLLFPLVSFAQFANWGVNDDHSEVFFQLSYLGQGEVTGRFTKFGGMLTLEKDLPKSISLSINADSINTGNNMRDNHLRSNDFLRSKANPEITFESTNINHIKDNSFWTLGTMSLGGESRPVKIKFELTSAVKDTWGHYSRFAKWKGKISRKDFNITWNKTLGDSKFLVGDVITIWGSFQLQPVKGATPSSKHMIPDTKYIREREKVARGEVGQAAAEKFAPKLSDVPMPETVMNEPAEVPVQPTKDSGRSFTWWISFSCLGLMGFFSSIILGLYSKKLFSEHFKYSETGILGHVSDFVTIIYVVIYSVALWYVGWG